MANYGKMAKEAAAEEKLIFTNPSMKKLRELRFGSTDWQHYNHISKEMLEQYNFNEYKKADITKVYNYTTKLLDDYEKEIDEKFAMELAKDNYYHNIPKEWITEKVWAVLFKNPVYKDYVNKNAIYVNKNLQKEAEISKRTYTPKETETAQENDAPATIEEIPIPTMANETANCTSNANETNVNKNLPKTVAKPKKNNYINTTNETKTTKTTKNRR